MFRMYPQGYHLMDFSELLLRPVVSGSSVVSTGYQKKSGNAFSRNIIKIYRRKSSFFSKSTKILDTQMVSTLCTGSCQSEPVQTVLTLWGSMVFVDFAKLLLIFELFRRYIFNMSLEKAFPDGFCKNTLDFLW